jgi:hypothetical protein
MSAIVAQFKPNRRSSGVLKPLFFRSSRTFSNIFLRGPGGEIRSDEAGRKNGLGRFLNLNVPCSPRTGW